MRFDEADVRFEITKGKGPGGQHKNKTCTTVRAIHEPTGCQVIIDGRSQAQNKKNALKVLKDRVQALEDAYKAKKRKAYRDAKIKTRNIIRTYDYRSGTVRDHRTGKVASLKQVMDKGLIQLLYPSKEEQSHGDLIR